MLSKRLLILTLSILNASLAYAAPHYRCGSVVRTRPCSMEFYPARGAKIPAVRSRNAHAELRHGQALFSNQSYEALNGQDGLWRGYVAGTGNVQLFLHIRADDKQPAAKKIGGIRLSGYSHPIRYTFKGPAPKAARWAWKVVAMSVPEDRI